MTQLRDALAAALESSETSESSETVEADKPVEVPQDVTAETPEARAERDEKGRFTAKQEAALTAVAVEQPRPPPSSWHKDQWGHWQKIDPAVQEYLHKREADYAKGVHTYKSQLDQFLQAVEPLKQAGLDPAQAIQRLAHADRALRSASPQEKLQHFAQLANEYGVSLQGLTGGQVDPQFMHLAQTVAALQNRLHQSESAQSQREHASLIARINEFAATKPHFEALKLTMGQLLGSGVADSLDTAYQKALRLNDELWQQEQARQADEAAKKRQVELERKKAAGSSPRSASPTGSMAAGNTKKDVRSILSEAFDSHVGGRV